MDIKINCTVPVEFWWTAKSWTSSDPVATKLNFFPLTCEREIAPLCIIHNYPAKANYSSCLLKRGLLLQLALL